MPPSFSHSPQCRITRRKGDNKGVGRKRTPGITNASDKAHHVQDTRVKGHGSFTIIVSRSSLSSPFRLLLFLNAFGCRASSVQPGSGHVHTRAGTTKGTAQRRERRRQMTGGSCSLSTEATSLPLKPRGRGLSCPRESLSDIPPPFTPGPPIPGFSRTLSFSLYEPVPRRVPLRASPALTLLSSFNLFSRVACSRPSFFSFSLVPP